MVGDRRARTTEKFELVKKCGFQGVEIDSPGTADLDELVKASKDDRHRHPRRHRLGPLERTRSRSPDAEVRAKGLAALKAALAGRQDRRGGHGAARARASSNKDVTYEQCWERSQAEVKKALPLAEKLGVKIAIEVVWNNFITKPEQLDRVRRSVQERRGSGRTSTART